MKKLKNKLFFTILILLSIFLISILFIFNYQDYKREKNIVLDNLSRMNDNPRKEDIIINNEIQPKLFMDAVVYTVILDNNNIIDIRSHNEENNDLEEIKDLANNIISSEKENRLYIGNLYFNKYSYSYQKNMNITIIDNSEINSRLKSSIQISLIIFIILELIIIYMSKKLTDWIIKPVIEAFDNQKRFIADASHELKTPIAVILASSEALEKDKDEKWIHNIKDESIRMNKLVTDLLELTKSEQSNKEFVITNISKLIEKSVLTLESLMYEKNIKLEYNIDDNIDFKCDSEAIKQLITILLDNAIKHSSKDGLIKVNLNTNKDIINLEVINKGEPIPKEDENKIFERFYRSDKSRNRNENRYGLGLAIAKNIVTNHNGVICAYSNDGYTTFCVNFKIK